PRSRRLAVVIRRGSGAPMSAATEAAVRLITFDVGGTLIHADPSVGAVYAEVLTRRGFPCDAGHAEGAVEGTWDTLAARRRPPGGRLGRGAQSERGFWRELLEEMVCRLGGDQVPEGASDELFERFARAEAWKPYEDVVPTLETLRREGISLAVVS